MSNEVASPYVRVDVVAKYFDVSSTTVRAWVKEGRIPASAYIKTGRSYRFRLPEVEAVFRAEGVQNEENVDQLNLDFGGDAA